MDKTNEAAGTVDVMRRESTKYGWAHEDGSACMEPAWCQRPHVKTPEIGEESEVESLRRQLQGAVGLVRALGSAWRTNDDEAISNALAQLEDWAGLREQGRQ